MQAWGVVLTAILYLLFLFLVASYGDRQRKEVGFQRSRPAIYALSLAIYCTSWTFFGSVGLATTSGLDFLAIYVGPILAVTLAFPIFSHMISVAKAERITSIADFLASRYGKSTATGALAALIAVVGTVPYIALQLKAISTSVETMVQQYQPLELATGLPVGTPFFVSLLLAVFAILFGTRHADATEHQGGLMLAVATESIVKLVAFLAVGIYVTFILFDGAGDIVEKAQQSSYVAANFKGGIDPPTFAVFTVLSFCAFLMLPRQFHVAVVENHSEQEARAARWMFPAYLVLINLFVVPVAIGGMLMLGQSVDPDSYVLAIPISGGASSISLLVFIGGLSAATAMVIVASVALAIMLSNNLVLPMMLRRDRGLFGSGRDMAPILLTIRRTAIFLIMSLAYAYFQVAGDTAALASIGLLSFAAIAQFAPAVFAGMFWRDANQRGALIGMTGGFAMWFYTLLLPTLIDSGSPLLTEGLFGFEFLKPRALFGVEMSPLTHGVLFSLGTNLLLLIGFSMTREPKPIERMQANVFSFFGRRAANKTSMGGRSITIAELQREVGNYVGSERAERAFERFALENRLTLDPRDLAHEELLHMAEQVLASAIGAASSRLVISLLLQRHDESGMNTMQLLGEASEALQQNHGILQTALDQVEQGISVFDADFRLSSWNKRFRELLDLPKELGEPGTPLTKVCDNIVDDWSWENEGQSDFSKQLLETGSSWHITHRTKGIVIEVDTKPMPTGGYVVSWHDITDRVQASRALQLANETLERRVDERTQELTQLNDDLAKAREAAEAANIGKTKFLAAVGHDILQPLNAARLYASSLREQLEDKPTEKLAANVDDSLESVEDIMSAVLAISRLDAGALTPNPTVFAVQSMMQRLELEFRPIAEQKGLKLVVKPSQLAVTSDFNLLRRLLQNLLSNAIKYTQNGSVTLDARLKRNSVIFEVADTGQGMSKKEQITAFEEFRRLDAGRAVAQGLGLGLSIVKRMAATLNHPIELQSTPAKGTTFQVSVPVAKGVVAQDERSGRGAVKGINLENLCVFCIDNEPKILDGMDTLLSNWGCDVHCFTHPADIYKASETITPDVVVADYHMEEENGLSVIANLRSVISDQLPAILITADRSADVRRAAKAAEIKVLNKPVKPAALRSLLATHAKQQELEPAE